MSPEKKSSKVAASSKSDLLAKAKAAIQKATGRKPMDPGNDRLGFVSTGSFPVDMLIGGSPARDGSGMICPGLPRRRITEIYGPESSGKTTLLISAMVQAQRAGGIAMFIDFEHALDHNYARNLGLSYDDDKLLVYQPDSMEEGFKMIYIGIKAGVDIIGVDSVAAMVPSTELDKGFDEAAKIGAVAAKFSRELPKFAIWLQKENLADGKSGGGVSHNNGTALVFINQVRALISTGYGGGHGDTENTTGGKALKFFAALRLRTVRVKSEMIERKDPITGKPKRFAYGNVTDVKVIKSKIDAKQGHSTQIFIRYGKGIDDYFSAIEAGVVQKVIKREGAFYTLGDKRFQGKDKFRSYLVENQPVFEALRTKLMQAINAGADNVSPDELDEDEKLLEGIDIDDDSVDGVDLAAQSEEVLAEIEDSSSTN